MSVRLPSIRLPRLASLPRLPGGSQRREYPEIKQPELPEGVDEFGLGPWARHLPRVSRRYIAVAYEHFHADKRLNPVGFFGVSQGTAPELVVFGFLLVAGFTPGKTWPKGFRFQQKELGGRRLPGGAVVDFEVYHNQRSIGVRVFSIYHALEGPLPLGGAAKQAENQRQRVRLMTSGRFDNIIDVNERYQLEQGPDPAVDMDLKRILTS